MKRLLDRVSLSPTRHSIDVGDATRVAVADGNLRLEAVRYQYRPSGLLHVGEPADLMLLKFVGAGGRAENLTPHPLEQWPNLAADVWSINPPGFGNSPGRAELASIVPTAIALYDHVVPRHDQSSSVPNVILMGTSLGGATAMAVAAERPVRAMLLRDVPHLQSVITQRFGWWTLGMANASTRHLPTTLDSIAAASKCTVPTVFITSGRDRIVPINIQREVIERYAGPRRVIHFPNADHGTPPEQGDLPAYFEALGWLRAQMAI